MPRSDDCNILARRWWFVVAALLLAYLTPYYWAHVQYVSSEFVFNDDERQWVWAMFRYADPDLFRNDYLFDYAMAGTSVGYKAVYWLGSAIVQPDWLSKFLSYGLLALTVVFASLSAVRLGGPMAGLATAGLLLVSGFLARGCRGWLAAVFQFHLRIGRPLCARHEQKLAACHHDADRGRLLPTHICCHGDCPNDLVAIACGRLVDGGHAHQTPRCHPGVEWSTHTDCIGPFTRPAREVRVPD